MEGSVPNIGRHHLLFCRMGLKNIRGSIGNFVHVWGAWWGVGIVPGKVLTLVFWCRIALPGAAAGAETCEENTHKSVFENHPPTLAQSYLRFVEGNDKRHLFCISWCVW